MADKVKIAEARPEHLGGRPLPVEPKEDAKKEVVNEPSTEPDTASKEPSK